MKKTYEEEVITDEYYNNINSRLKEGWEIVKIEAISKSDSCLFFKSSKIVKVYHLRRETTPTKIKVNITTTVPKWKINTGNVDHWEFSNEIEAQLIKQGLKKKKEEAN